MPSRVFVLILTVGILGIAESDFDEAAFEARCREAIIGQWPEQKSPELAPGVREWAKDRGFDPTTVYGDFDADGERDVAFLIQAALESKFRQVAVCLSSVGARKPLAIESLYCSDGISSVLKGRPYHDFENDSEGTYPRDGIHAFCFEKAGATYLYEGGSFRRIIDSD